MSAEDDARKAMEGLAKSLQPVQDLMRSVSIPQIPLPPPPITTPAFPPMDGQLASGFYKRLTSWIRDFDAALDPTHEVGVRLVSFGQSMTFHLRDISYWNPLLISFSGETETGDAVELIQHVSQISILLLTLPRKDPSVPKNPIGFQQTDE